MLVLLCTRMASRCGAFSLSDGRFSSRCINSLAEMVPRYPLLGAFGPWLSIHPGVCNNLTWRMLCLCSSARGWHRGAARSASLMADSHLGASTAWLKWCLGTPSWEHLARCPHTLAYVIIRPGVCNACASLHADGIEVRRVQPL